MYADLFNGLKLKEEDLEKYDSPLVGFDGKQVIPRGMIRLPVQVEGTEVQVNFIVVRAYSPYMAILARPWLHAMGAVSSTLHVMVKYPIQGRVEILHGSQSVARQCLMSASVNGDGGSAEELDKIFIGEDIEKYFQVGSQLPVPEREELVKFLQDNIDVFAWVTHDVPGIDPEFICHHLNVSPHAVPHKQPPRRASQEHAEAVEEEIPMSLSDQEKTAFRAPNGNYHYRVMPLGLKNANSTYQRMVTRMFELQLRRNMEAYIDDMVIKSKEVGDHVKNLHETFLVLRRYKLRLNASKCSFGVSSGKFLGYMITHQGIEGLHPPRNPKEVQKLAGMFAALNRFISRSADRCRPFYRLLHKWKDFQWIDECNLTFEDLKQYLANPPILSRPEKEEVLYAYLAVTDYAVSLVLIRNDDGVQKSVYYISKSLQEAERQNLPLEKALLAVVHATRKLPHYFQAHTIVVLTQLPLQAIMRKSDYIGRVAKWGTKLRAYDVKYMPRTAIKGQVLADFVAEFTESGTKQEDVMLAVMSIGLRNVLLWEVYTDGALNRKGAEIGIVLITLEKLIMEKSLRLGFVATNSEAKYKALLAGAQMVRHLGGEIVELYCDSRLVVEQVNGEFEARDERMKKYLERVKGVLGLFKSFKVRQILRGQNAHADSLAMLATSLGSKLPWMVMVEDLLTSSLTSIPVVEVHNIRVGSSWMDLIVTFLQCGVLPEDKVEAEKVQRSAPRYWLSGEHKLYKHSYSGPYLLCVHPEAVEPLLEELHEGICGSHMRGRSLTHKAMTQGYWWPNMQKASQEYVKKCDQCQSKACRRYCTDMGIRNGYSTPAYPQGNGQAEATNKVILTGLKK
ncbi:uncharacterized protein LOC142632848 [Castanea sativa]|uniref:uncharacterized protein LOC142632848 n=1 Tax=Castanea sativa TaxID=21020 RepID=UPI003F64B81F